MSVRPCVWRLDLNLLSLLEPYLSLCVCVELTEPGQRWNSKLIQFDLVITYAVMLVHISIQLFVQFCFSQEVLSRL